MLFQFDDLVVKIFFFPCRSTTSSFPRNRTKDAIHCFSCSGRDSPACLKNSSFGVMIYSVQFSLFYLVFGSGRLAETFIDQMDRLKSENNMIFLYIV